jgi:hypothetical protein
VLPGSILNLNLISLLLEGWFRVKSTSPNHEVDDTIDEDPSRTRLDDEQQRRLAALLGLELKFSEIELKMAFRNDQM